MGFPLLPSLQYFSYHGPDDGAQNAFTNAAGESASDAAVAELAAALRASPSLETLVFGSCEALARRDVGVALLSALAGHPRLLVVGFPRSTVLWDVTAAGRALAALVTAASPLRVLNVCGSAFGDAGLAPVRAAVAVSRPSWATTYECFGL